MREEFNQREYEAFLRTHKKEAAVAEQEALETDAASAQEKVDSKKLASGAAADLRTYKSGTKGLAAEVDEGLLAVRQIDEIEEEKRSAKESSDWLKARIGDTSYVIKRIEALEDRVDEIGILDWLKKGNLKRQLLSLRKKLEGEQHWLGTRMEPSSPGLDEEERRKAETRIGDMVNEVNDLEASVPKLKI